MRILAIRGRNLASLEGNFAIDFTMEPLASAGIFAISGPTGAGKSTLLDAMCLALFSKTPRTEQARENNVRLKDVNEDVLVQGDPRFLLRRGTSSGYAEVDFEALNGFRYRARWAVARARDKENGRMQPARTLLYNLDTGKEEQGSRSDLQARIVELIGLTFEQFTRSVLLAQNDFSTFLKAEQGEKAALLEKLTGTERYSEISRVIFAKNAEAKAAYEELCARVQGIELLPEEERERLRARLSEAEKQFAGLEKARSERQRLMEAVSAAEERIALKERQRKENELALGRTMASREALEKELTRAERERTEYAEEVERLRVDLRNARKLDVQLETVAKAAKEDESRMRDIGRRKQAMEEKAAGVGTRQRKNAEEWEQLSAWRMRYQNKAGIAEQFAALLVHLDACEAARLAEENVEKLLVTLRQQGERLEIAEREASRKREALAKERQSMEQERQQVNAFLEELRLDTLDALIEACRTERERLLLEQAQFVTTGDIKALRDKLIAGKPCPVCGSVEHPYASHEAHERLLVLANGISEATLRLKDLLGKKEKGDQCRKRLAELQRKEIDCQKLLSIQEQECTEIKQRREALLERMEREAANKGERREALSKSLSAANELFGNDAWQTNWMRDPIQFRETLTGFVQQWQAKGERLRVLEQERGALAAEQESYEAFLPPLRAQYEEAMKIHEEKTREYDRLAAERKAILGGKPADEVEKLSMERLDALEKRLRGLRDDSTRQAGELEKLRGSDGQIRMDLEEASRALTSRKQELTDWKARYERETGGKTLEELLNECSTLMSECAFRLRTHDENERKIAASRQELEERKAVSERWAKLNELAGSADGAKFRRIAQGYTLDILLSYANVHLRQLSRRYRLERVPETLALQVIDQDMCDEVRTVHSLSGGESFLVSLALALGLSSLSSNRMKVESLFIDEGFGSLDAETLRVAMDALESLRTQGRKIGVISHVQEMTERIPVQIRVNRAGNGRSYLEVVG